MADFVQNFKNWELRHVQLHVSLMDILISLILLGALTLDHAKGLRALEVGVELRLAGMVSSHARNCHRNATLLLH